MKRYAGIMLILCGPFIAFSAASHPYDTALEFHEHKTDDGRPIYTNIPKKCFSKGRLTCRIPRANPNLRTADKLK
jgi:hypothetical protein